MHGGAARRPRAGCRSGTKFLLIIATGFLIGIFSTYGNSPAVSEIRAGGDLALPGGDRLQGQQDAGALDHGIDDSFETDQHSAHDEPLPRVDLETGDTPAAAKPKPIGAAAAAGKAPRIQYVDGKPSDAPAAGPTQQPTTAYATSGKAAPKAGESRAAAGGAAAGTPAAAKPATSSTAATLGDSLLESGKQIEDDHNGKVTDGDAASGAGDAPAAVDHADHAAPSKVSATVDRHAAAPAPAVRPAPLNVSSTDADHEHGTSVTHNVTSASGSAAAGAAGASSDATNGAIGAASGTAGGTAATAAKVFDESRLPGNTIHTLYTSNGSPYQNFQGRIHYATYRLVQKMPGAAWQRISCEHPYNGTAALCLIMTMA